MIPESAEQPQPAAWQHELRRAYTDGAQLLRALGLAAGRSGLDPEPPDFPLRVPRGFVNRMRAGDRDDPLLLQVLPLAAERASAAGYCRDPVGDSEAEVVPGLLHKYCGRVLLVVTGSCAIHCRYCFRRHFPYARSNPARDHWQAALSYIRADPSLREVILSGGDPLSLSDTRLASLSEALAAIPHVRRLRIHSRIPIVLPERVDQHLLQWLRRCRMQKVMVVHANHPREIDAGVVAALQRLRDAGVTLLNQSVLLHAVNDALATLVELSEVLMSAGVLPYYLHQLDPVQGAAHFQVAPETAAQLLDGLRRRLPGYLVPRLVVERRGEAYKLPLELVYT
ncbi:MAG: EF-P beta-lysylation protein EpmB [Gammaproteobacteria bacterium]